MSARDPVNHPKHYTGHASGVECIQITEHMNFCLGNAVKYIWRAGEKGDAVKDLRKARWYLDREIARLSDGMGQDRRACVPSVAPVAAGEGASPPRVNAESGPQEVSPDAPARAELPAVPPTPRQRGPKGTYRTPERLAILRRDYPAGRPTHEIRAAMEALPGGAFPASNEAISTWAYQIGLRRPAGYGRGAAIAAGKDAAKVDLRYAALASWADALAWAQTVDPDMVLKGSQAERLAQINELRVLEGLKPFVLAPLAEAA
jgi:hypothetical protein